MVKASNIIPRQLVIIRADFFFLLLGSNINCECSFYTRPKAKERSKSLQICITKFAWNYIISNWIKLNANSYNLLMLPRLGSYFSCTSTM